jgi:hypothetical protein
MINKIKSIFKKNNNLRYKKKLISLIPNICDHIKKNKSCEASFSDYYQIYNYIIKFKPKYILECGSGISSFVIARALQENYKNTGFKALLISMEENSEYYEDIKKNFPLELNNYVDFRLSPRVEKKYSFYCGVGYKDIPKFDYEFVFIDGPNTVSPIDGIRKFDFDLITAVEMSAKPITCFIDHRLSTVCCYQNIFTKKKVKYDKSKNLGIVTSVTQKYLVRDWNRHNFKFNFFNKEFIFKNSSD